MYSSVTHIFTQRDRYAMLAHVEKTVRQNNSQFLTPPWHGELEAALLDAVFTARALYGGPENGVRRVITRWREHRGTERIDDLSALASHLDTPDELAEILGNRQRVARNSTTKADAVARVASILTGFGIRNADQFYGEGEHRKAVTAITGIGVKTWECALFLAGQRNVDSLLHFTAFASDAVGRRLEGEEAELLLVLTAESLEVDHAALEHAVWRYQRRIGPAPQLHALSETG